MHGGQQRVTVVDTAYVFRQLGVRTHREIARERYALKAMRGDFDDLSANDAGAAKRVRAALAAVDK